MRKSGLESGSKLVRGELGSRISRGASIALFLWARRIGLLGLECVLL